MLDNESIEIIKSSLSSPFVTIAIPTYKRALYLKEAVDSALNQSGYNDYEVLVCDNNPERNDETERLMSNYNDSRISYYKNSENIGIVGNWNNLYKLAKGDWVVMLHDDDLIAPFFLDYIFCRKKIQRKGDLIFPAITCKKSRFINSNSESDRMITYPKTMDFIQNNLVGPPLGMTMKKKIYEDIGAFSTKFYPSPDYAFYVDALLKKKKIVKLLGEPMAYYRIEVNTSLKSEMQIGFVKNIFEIGQYIISQSSPIYQPFMRNYSYISSYNAAKSKLERFPENEALQNIMKQSRLNLFQMFIAKIIRKIMSYRRKLCFPDFCRQYDTD